MRRALPLLLGILALAISVGALALSLGREPVFDTVAYTFLSVAMAAAGALVASRVRGNPIGWILIAVGVEAGLGELTEGWGLHPELPGSDAVAWVSASFAYVGIGLLPLLLMVFPTGGLPSPRWRIPFWIAVMAIPLSTISSAFSHAAQRAGSDDPNPIAAPGPWVDAVFLTSQVAVVVGLVAAIASLVVRFRRGGPIERQQLKWVGFSAGLLVLVGPFALALYNDSLIVRLAIAAVIVTLPITIAIAVLRYRLYAIDRIISRTASWAIVTVLVVGAYALVVVAISAVLPGLPSIAVALATLVAAAIFLPVLRRVQHFVDRRFNRAQYNAQKVVDEFGDRLRSGSNPHLAGAELVGAVEQALQPNAVGLWIRTDATG